MAELDKLSIKITSDASAANRSITALAEKIEKMSKALGGLDSGSISDFSKGLKTLTESLNSFSGSEKDAEKFKVMAKGIRSFTSIKSGELKSIASAITPLANGIAQVNSISFDGKSVTSFVNAITRLAKADAGALANVDFGAIGNKMKGLTEALSGAATIDSRTQSLINSITRLANAGDKSTTVSANLESLGSRLKSAIEKIAGADVSKASQNTILLTQAIAQLANAGAKAETTASHLENLGEKTVAFIKKLEGAPQVSKNTSQLVTAIGNIAGAGSRANGAFNSIATSGTRNVSVLSKLGNAFKKLIPGMNRANKSSKGLASTFGMFYAKFFIVIRAIKALGNAIGSAQDYIEEFNYFSVALDKIGRDSASQFREAGYNSAEEYAKSFRGRFTKLQRQMTGYDVNTDTGELTGGLRKSLGLNISEVMNFQAAIAQITNSAGMLGETSIKTSKALSMLSADWSSLSNTDLSDVMNNMQSALIGQSRSVYKYGIDITAAGLAQTAMNHGLQVNVKNLSQASKMQLRLLTILEQSKVAYGDLAKTINQPANQLRMLEAGIKNLSREIAGLLLPVIQRVYPYLNAIVMVLQEFVEWIGKLTGANLKAVAGSMKTPDLGYEDAADDSGDMADNTKKAAKEAKKLSDNLQGFDIINKLDKKDDSDSGAGTSGLGNQNLDLSGDIDAALKNYEKIWNKAFKSNENKAARLAKKIKKALLSGWEKGDFTELGKKLAKWISDGLDNIPWAGIRKVTKKLAKSIATFLNGFIGDKKLWKKVATTLAKGFNTAVTSLYTFVTTLDWLKFGQNIADGINTAIKKANFKKAGKTLGASLRGIIQTAFGALTNVEYATIGKKISNFINGFLDDMGEVRETGLTGWQELGRSIGDGAKGILDTISTALEKVRWTDVGKAIGDFIGSIDWVGVLAKTGKALAKALGAIFTSAISAFISNPIGVTESIATFLGGLFAYRKLKVLLPRLVSSFKTLLGDGIRKGIKRISETKIGKLISEKLAGVSGTKLALSVTLLITSFEFAHNAWKDLLEDYSLDEVRDALGAMVGDSVFGKGVSAIFGDGAGQDFGKSITGWIAGLGTLFSGEYSWEEWGNGLKEMLSDLGSNIGGFFSNIGKSVLSNIKNPLDKAVGLFQKSWSNIKDTWTNVGVFFGNKMNTVLANVKRPLDKVVNLFKTGWTSVKTAWSLAGNFFTNIWGKIKGAFSNVKDWFGDKFSKAWGAVKDAFSGVGKFFAGIWDTIKTSSKSPLNSVVGVFEKLVNNFIDSINGIIRVLNKIPKFDIKEAKHVELPRFATGGFPEDGLFMANRGELVGQFGNGKTAVANNQQITQGIAEAVAPAVYSAVLSAMRESEANRGSTEVYLDTTKVTKEVMNRATQISRSRGAGWSLA